MVIYKSGTFTVTAGGAAQNLVLGFIPSHFRALNINNYTTPANAEVMEFDWYSTMANGTALTKVYNATPVLTGGALATTGVTPFQTTDQLLYVPAQTPYTDTTRVPMGASTALVITGISKAANAVVLATNSFTAADEGVTVVTFSGNNGMSEINTLRGVITSVISNASFAVNIDSTNFSTWVVGGNPQCNVITGAPVSTLYSNQILNTAQANLGKIGLTFGIGLMQTTNDVWHYEAFLQSPAT